MKDLAVLIRTYFDYKNLEAFIEKEKSQGGLKESLILVTFAQLISFFAISLATIIGSFFSAELASYLSPASFAALLVFAVIGVLFFYIFSGILFILSKILGGKGSFSSQSYALSVIMLAATAVSFPVSLFMHVEAVGILISLISLALTLYMVYAQYKTMKAVHQLSWIKAAAVVGVLWLAIFAFLVTMMMLLMMGPVPVPV